jgi:FkbM family methyltransferase
MNSSNTMVRGNRGLVSTEASEFPLRRASLETVAIVRFPFRAGRRVTQALRHRLGAPQRKRWKRKVLFPVRNLLFRGKPISVGMDGVSVRLAPRGATAADLWSGLWLERCELALTLSVLEPGMTFLDIGANAGLFAVAAAKKMSCGKVYAFEPCAGTYQLLEQNLRLNGVNNVTAIRMALSDHIGEAVLQVHAPANDGRNTIGTPAGPDSQVIGQERVPLTTLDSFLEANAISRVDAMRVDVEGAELPVLRGARNLLERKDAPLILYTGYSSNTRGFGYHPVEMMWRLGDCGYSLFVLDCETGEAAPRRPGPEYDAVIVAAKPGHPSYRKLAEGNR